MAREPKPKKATPEEREKNRRKIRAELDASENRIRKVISGAAKRRQKQRDAGNFKGAQATLDFIDRCRVVELDILRAQIKFVDNSMAVAELIKTFKQTNKDLAVERKELEDLAKTLKRIGKIVGVLEKLILKVATSGVA